MKLYGTTLFLFIAITNIFASEIQDFDNSIYEAIHDGWRSNACDNYFNSANFCGEPEFYLSVNLAFLCFGDNEMNDSGKLTCAGLAATMLTAQLLKCAIGRDRPKSSDTPRCKSSMPSGHTTSAFTMAYIYSAQYPKLRIPLYFVAVSVGLSRIYLGEHYPTDVITGAVLGTIGGIVVMENKHFILQIGF